MPGVFALCLTATTLLFFSCGKQEEMLEPEEHFTRIYDNQNFDKRYRPIDIAETNDGGYIILGKTVNEEYTFPVAYLLKVDKMGEYEWDLEAAPLVNPVSKLFIINNEYYFFAMDDISLQTVLSKVSDGSRIPQTVETFPDVTYPLSVSGDESGYLMQYYNRNNSRTTLVKMNNEFLISWKKEYPVYQDVEATIISHLKNLDQELTFFSGEAKGGSLYYFTGIYNYTFALIFQNPAQENFGLINGYQLEGGISAALPIDDTRFALSWSLFGYNFLLPTHAVQPAANVSVGDTSNLTGLEIPELENNSRVVIGLITVKETEVLLYAATTRSGQIVLYAYDPETGELLGSRYWGNAYPYRAAAFTPTSDGGIALAGETYLAGRFRRLCLFKISESHLAEIAGL